MLLCLDYALYPGLARIGGDSPNTGDNGLWLRYWWYFGQRTDAEIVALARQLQRDQIRDAYFHVRHIKADGTLAYHYPGQARHLLRLLRRHAPQVRAIAWVYAGNRRGEGEVDLTGDAVRRAMVDEALWLCRDCGFDGVQWDYEVCPDGDAGFLRLMQQTAAALPKGKLLSTAVPVWAPAPISRRWGWSERYFSQIAATCDQLAVMCYDTGLAYPRAYVGFLRLQPRHILPAVQRGNPDCRVLFGLPTYKDGPPCHSPHAERLSLAIKGVREGLDAMGAQAGNCEGIALFADYTTTPDDWEVYRRGWLR